MTFKARSWNASIVGDKYNTYKHSILTSKTQDQKRENKQEKRETNPEKDNLKQIRTHDLKTENSGEKYCSKRVLEHQKQKEYNKVSSLIEAEKITRSLYYYIGMI